MRRVAIIGGGLSGLSAAYQLTREPEIAFTLFEASTRLGGIVETVRRDGFVVECGPDSWVTEKPWARELAVELGLAEEIIPSKDAQRRTYILQEGNRLTPMPDGMRMMVPTNMAAMMDSPLFNETARHAYLREPEQAEELRALALKDGEDESVAAFVRRHFGDEVTRTLAGPLLAGVFGGDIHSLSVRAVMPVFVKMEREHGSLIRALQARSGTNEGAVFTTLRSGLGTLIDRIAAALPADCIRLHASVTALEREAQGWHVRTEQTEEIFDAVIVATPAHVTRHLLSSLHSGFANTLAMEASSAIIVALAFSPEQALSLKIPRGFGYLVPPQQGADSQLLACTFVDQKFPHRAPHGATLLRAFFGSEAAARLLHESEEAITALALQRLSDVLGLLPTPQFSLVRRWPFSLPQYAVGHPARMAELEALVTRFPGLHLAGNAYYGVGLPDMVRMGREAARRAAHR